LTDTAKKNVELQSQIDSSAEAQAALNRRLSDKGALVARLESQLKSASRSMSTKDGGGEIPSTASEPTHVQLQFNESGEKPVQLSAMNVRSWGWYSFTERMGVLCIPGPFGKVCVVTQPHGDGTDSDRKTVLVGLYFEKPVIYKDIKLNAHGAMSNGLRWTSRIAASLLSSFLIPPISCWISMQCHNLDARDRRLWQYRACRLDLGPPAPWTKKQNR
jgi:hypothetical protein